MGSGCFATTADQLCLQPCGSVPPACARFWAVRLLEDVSGSRPVLSVVHVRGAFSCQLPVLCRGQQTAPWLGLADRFMPHRLVLCLCGVLCFVGHSAYGSPTFLH